MSTLLLTTLPEGLPLLRARLTMRLLVDAVLPSYKGAMLRGGFGHAFMRASCAPACWEAPNGCALESICPYRWVFETPHPPQIGHLHDLQDVPRPFVVEPPLDQRTHYAAGEAIEFGLVLIGRGIDYLTFFLFGFEQLGRMGLGGNRAPARLERVEVLQPWQPTGQVIYQDGRAAVLASQLPFLDAAAITARAATLPADLRLTLQTPLRVKSRSDYIRALDLPAIVQAACWRLNALSTFHGAGPWPVDHRALVEQVRGTTVVQQRIEWVDWERTSSRGAQLRSMKLGGIVGSALLRGVTPEVGAILLAGSVMHVGKACVFGHGAYRLEPIGAHYSRE